MTHAAFDERLTRISQRHRRLAAGVRYRIGPDGLLVPVPRRPAATPSSLRLLLALVAVAYACKLLLFLGLGEGTYVARLDLLRGQGDLGEMAVQLLEPDPAMRVAAEVAAVVAQGAWLRLP